MPMTVYKGKWRRRYGGVEMECPRCRAKIKADRVNCDGEVLPALQCRMCGFNDSALLEDWDGKPLFESTIMF